MATRINIRHKESGMVKTGFYGFSWTYLLFGWLVPLFRSELGVGALHLVFTIFTLGFWQIIACFLYNKHYMTRMLTNGWVLDGSDSDIVLAGTALGISTSSTESSRQDKQSNSNSSKTEDVFFNNKKESLKNKLSNESIKDDLKPKTKPKNTFSSDDDIFFDNRLKK